MSTKSPSTEAFSGTIIATLRSARLFSGLSEHDLVQIEQCCERRLLERHGYLFHEGDPALGFFIVQSGIVNVHRLSEGGREQVVRVFHPGESFAEGVLAGMEGYPVSARAESAVVVILVRRAELVGLIRRGPEMALRIIASMSRHLHHLVTQLESMRDSSVSDRLRQWLLDQCPRPLPDGPVTIRLPGTKSLLAAELGTVAETLSRALASFREQGWITVEGREITLASPTRLAAGMDERC